MADTNVSVSGTNEGAPDPSVQRQSNQIEPNDK